MQYYSTSVEERKIIPIWWEKGLYLVEKGLYLVEKGLYLVESGGVIKM